MVGVVVEVLAKLVFILAGSELARVGASVRLESRIDADLIVEDRLVLAMLHAHLGVARCLAGDLDRGLAHVVLRGALLGHQQAFSVLLASSGV